MACVTVASMLGAKFGIVARAERRTEGKSSTSRMQAGFRKKFSFSPGVQ